MLLAEDTSVPKIVLPVRRSVVAEASVRAEAGFRIESRFHAPSSEPAEALLSSPLEVTELGKGIVRLGGDAAVNVPPKQEQLPVMQPRPSRAETKAAEAGTWGVTRSHSHRWMIWSGAAVACSVVAALALQPLLEKKAETPRTTYYDKLQVVEDVANLDDPVVYFTEHPDEVGQQMITALTAYARARTVKEVLPFVRNGEHLHDELKKHWKPWNVPADWTPTRDAFQGYTSVGKLPYGIMSDTLPDFHSYTAYFVRSGGRMLVDWEATAGTGTTNLQGLNQAATTEAVVRIMISPTSFYTATYPESAYLSYQATRPDSDEVAWIYAPKASVAGESLGKLFQAGDILGSADISPQPVRLRLGRNPEGGLANQWQALDVLHKGWVSP